MRGTFLALSMTVAFPLVAQAPPNPFSVQLRDLPAYTIDYTYGGDMTGTSRVSAGGDRMVTVTRTTGAFFGQQSDSESWQLMTPEEMWIADLKAGTGTKAVNPIPFMEQAYDDLSRADKERVHANMKEMMAFVSQAMPSTPFGGAAVRQETVAGERCDVYDWGMFSFCSMRGFPIVLKSSGSMFCVSFDQTATAVTRSTDAAMFAEPAGIRWTEDLNRARADSSARAWVEQLASKGLADSLAEVRGELEANKAEYDQAMASITPEMCDMLKDYSLATALEGAFSEAFDDIVADAAREVRDETVNEAKSEAKSAVKRGLRGILGRP